jgi:UDP-3-O-[3-hydroxymyristoyl] glucosamine N-acyltransferase
MLRATLHEQEIRRAIGTPGEGDQVVEGVAPLDAGTDRCLYFVKGEPTEGVRAALSVRRGCIVIARRRSIAAAAFGACRVLEVAQPRLAIARVLAFVQAEGRLSPWIAGRTIAEDAVISPLAAVEGNVEIGAGVVVEPFCTIGPDVSIGRGSVIRSGARIGPRVSIGEETVIGLNAVVGSEGFGFVRDEAGNRIRIPHLGGIMIGSHVEIGATSSVQYGTLAPTTLEDYVKIDDNVAVGHNARLARGVSLTGGVIIGGSVVIGADAWVGLNASIRDGRRVGSHALVGMDASVQDDVPEEAVARAPRPDIRPHLGRKLTP